MRLLLSVVLCALGGVAAPTLDATRASLERELEGAGGAARAAPSVRVLKPEHGALYNLTDVPLSLEVENFRLVGGGDDAAAAAAAAGVAAGVVCFQVMWDQGTQSYCNARLPEKGAEWAMRGLEDHEYALVATLHAGGDGDAPAVASAHARYTVR